MSQNIVVYLVTDKDGTEWIYQEEPRKKIKEWIADGYFMELPTGAIKKLTGKDLTWDSGYMEYVGENYDPTPE